MQGKLVYPQEILDQVAELFPDDKDFKAELQREPYYAWTAISRKVDTFFKLTALQVELAKLGPPIKQS